jgi:hypothetical protein
MSAPRRTLTTACALASLLIGPQAHRATGEEVRLLDGKVRIQLPETWRQEKENSKQALASFGAKKGDAWGGVVRGTRGLQPDGLTAYAATKIAEYTKGLSWLPNLTWLKKEVVTIDRRKWADLRFIGKKESAKDPLDGLLYTRIFATSYEGQLLEFTFSSNTDPNRETKLAIDKIVESVRISD